MVMELRKTWKFRHSSSAQRLLSNPVELFWNSFVIIASWTDAVGLGRFLRILLGLTCWLFTAALLSWLVIVGNAAEKVLGRFLTKTDVPWKDEQSTRRHCWLSAIVVETFMSKQSFVEQVNNVLFNDQEGCDRQSAEHDACTNSFAIKSSASDEVPEKLPKYLSELASKPLQGTDDIELKVLSMSSDKTFISQTFYVLLRTAKLTSMKTAFEKFAIPLKPQHLDNFAMCSILSCLDIDSSVLLFMTVLPKLVSTVHETVKRLFEEKSSFPIFKRLSPREGPRSLAWTDAMSRELLGKLEEKSHASPEEIAMSCIVMALRSYAQVMTGLIPEDISALVLNGEAADFVGGRLRLPLDSAHDVSSTVSKVSLRHTRSQRTVAEDGPVWSIFKRILPAFAFRYLSRHYFGRCPVIVQNYHLEESNPIGAGQIKSLHQWIPLLYGSIVTFNILHLNDGLTISICSDKRTIQSATLLAECIDKAVNNLCIFYSIHWNRKSPPSTPVVF